MSLGYRLRNTVSDYGTVTRGVCIQDGGRLCGLRETYNIKKYADGSICDTENPENELPLDPDSLVSMNYWGFSPWIFGKIEQYFNDFLATLPEGELKAECLLPTLVDILINSGELEVAVIATESVWFGVTYQEDKPVVKAALLALHDAGVYPDRV